MRILDEILKQVRRLSAQDRRELVEKIQSGELDEKPKVRLTDEERDALEYFTSRPRWTPPKGAPSIVELLREDRDR